MSVAMRTNGLCFLTLLGLAVAGAAGCGENPIPDFPTYALDIRPLMQARCVRCHGAGGTLNDDPDSKVVNATRVPTNGYFDRLEEDATGTKHGLLYYATGLGVGAMKLFLPQMPPAPGSPLTDRELQLLKSWLANPLP